MEVKRLDCEVPVFMKHQSKPTKVIWREEFPVKVKVAMLSMSQVLTGKLRFAMDESLISFTIILQSRPHELADAEFITEDMLSSLRVDVSFPEGSLYGQAVELRAFLQELTKCIIKDGSLMLPDEQCPVFKFEHESFIVVRECYPILFECIVKRAPKARVALSGTPGIGKTCFLMYFLWRLILQSSKEYPRILFHDCEGDRFVLYEDGSVQPLIDQPAYAKAQKARPNMWYLVDSVVPEATSFINILLVTSPNENLVKTHVRTASPFATWYMPSWAEHEIECLIALKGDSPVVRKNQEKFGNIPRSLYAGKDSSLAELEKAWEDAVGSITRRALINVLSGSDGSSKIFHHVIHVEVPEWNLPKCDFTTIYLKFASPMSQKAIVENLCVGRSQELESLLQDTATTSIAASLCGSIFEAYAFRIMKDYSQYPWRARVLAMGSTHSQLSDFRPCCGTDMSYAEFDYGSDIIFATTPENTLFKARRKNYAGIDGVCADGIFNMTVRAEHGIILKDEVIELIESGINEHWFQVHDPSRNAIRYLFFVPWYAFGGWKQMQPVKHGSYTFVDPTNLTSLSFELVQIAVEVPRPQSLIHCPPSS